MLMQNITAHLGHAPQSEPTFGREAEQVQNNAGGYVFRLDKWGMLTRFLILGSEGGTYYASERKVTLDNASNVLACIAEDGPRVVREIVAVSDAGRAPRNTPALFALALAAKSGNEITAAAAYLALPKVARTGTHLFEWVEAVKALGGVSSGAQRAIARWYQEPRHPASVESHHRWLAMQAVKYQSRGGWSHRDLLRLAKPGAQGRKMPRTAATDRVLSWMTGKGPEHTPGQVTDFIDAFEEAKRIGNAPRALGPGLAEIKAICDLINKYNLPREAIPTYLLNSATVWEALLTAGRGMPMTALIRNLNKLTAVGVLGPNSEGTRIVEERLLDHVALRASRIHPMQILTAWKVYGAGQGDKGSLTWNPVPAIVGALEEAFLLAFPNVEPTGKRWLLGLDVSGSMGFSAGEGKLTAREVSAAMSMITLATEAQVTTMAFSNTFTPLALHRRSTLQQTLDAVSNLNFGSTDCALPMLWAAENKIPVDVFTVYTDNETWFGQVHPFQALRDYRQKMGIDAKLIVAGVTATDFTIADPSDAGMLDVVGFDAGAPAVMADFARGGV